MTRTLSLAAAALLVSATAVAQSGAPSASAQARPKASAVAPPLDPHAPTTLPPGHPPTSDPHAGAALPPGHPPMGQAASDDDHGDEAAMPPGHPPTGQGAGDEAAMPPGHPSTGHAHEQGAPAGIFQPPEDVATEDPSVPAGTLVAELRDADDKPIAGASITLAILHNSVAKGESRERREQVGDGAGRTTFAGLEVGSGVAYRVMHLVDGATFSAPPIQLPEGRGARVVLHAYPVTHEMPERALFTRAFVYIEVKDDRVQIQQEYRLVNVGRVAWVPSSDTIFPLPPEFTGFSSQQGMTDVAVDGVEKLGARLRGTLSPGSHSIMMRWQLPYAGEDHVAFDLTMPPGTVVAQVMTPGSKSMSLEASDFGASYATTDNQGQRVLVADRQARDEPIRQFSVAVRGLPSSGYAPHVATGLALLGVALGLTLARREEDRASAKASLDREQDALLDDARDLEAAHASGEIGPETYERARRELVRKVASVLARKAALSAPAKAAKPPRPKAARRAR